MIHRFYYSRFLQLYTLAIREKTGLKPFFLNLYFINIPMSAQNRSLMAMHLLSYTHPTYNSELAHTTLCVSFIFINNCIQLYTTRVSHFLYFIPLRWNIQFVYRYTLYWSISYFDVEKYLSIRSNETTHTIKNEYKIYFFSENFSSRDDYTSIMYILISVFITASIYIIPMYI